MSQNKRKHSGLWLAIVSCSSAFALHSNMALAISGVLEEVVVEAQKKLETVTETPIAVNAQTGEQFLKGANFNLQDLSRSIPGLTVETGVNVDIHLRGTGTVSRAPVSLRTNVYQDGTLVEQPRVIFDSQFDIERFELLRGPQGTLYGKSSPTGTMNIRTKNPNLREVDGYVSGTVADHNTFNGQFGVSLPIIEGKLAVRLSGVYDENQATDLHNDTTHQDAQKRTKAERIVVLWDPTDSFEARFAWTYREATDNPWYTTVGSFNGKSYSVDDNKVLTNSPDYNNARDQIATLELTKTLNDHVSIVSVSSYLKQVFVNHQDPDGVYPVTAGPAWLVTQEYQDVTIHIDPVLQQDLRILSEDNNFFDWQLGAFYQRSASQTPVTDYQEYSPAGPISANVNTALLANFNREEWALYTHDTFKLNDELNLILGARYQTNRATGSQPTNIALSPAAAFGNGLPFAPFSYSLDAIGADGQSLITHAWTGTAKLQYFFSPDLMGYVTLDRAYRAGAPNLNLASNLPADFTVIKPESANSIEFGLKGNFWDQRGRFSTAIYDQIYKDFQQDIVNIDVYNPNGGGHSNISSLVAAAKEAETRGIDAEVNLLLVDGWDVGLSVSFTDAKYKDFKNNPCSGDVTALTAGNPYNTCDLSNERMPQSSRWSGVFTSNYSRSAFARADWYLNGMVHVNSDQVDELTRRSLGGYSTIDLFTGLRASNKGPWDVSLWVKNAFDKRVITRVYKLPNDVAGNPAGYELDFANLPRQVGVTGTYRF